MAAVLFFLFLLVPLAEIAVLIQVGQLIGPLPTIVSLICISVAGAVIAKREGVAVWRRLRASLSRGELPATEVADGFLVLAGGALLLTPGFLTDVVGLALIFPLSRAAIRRGLRRGTGWFLLARFPFLGPLRDAAANNRGEEQPVDARGQVLEHRVRARDKEGPLP